MSIKKVAIQGTLTVLFLVGIFFLGAQYGVETSDAAQNIDIRVDFEQHAMAREPITVVELSNHDLFSN